MLDDQGGVSKKASAAWATFSSPLRWKASATMNADLPGFN